MTTDQGDDYRIDCLLDCLLVLDLSKQQALHIDSNAIHQIGFTENLDQPGIRKMFFTMKK